MCHFCKLPLIQTLSNCWCTNMQEFSLCSFNTKSNVLTLLDQSRSSNFSKQILKLLATGLNNQGCHRNATSAATLVTFLGSLDYSCRNTARADSLLLSLNCRYQYSIDVYPSVWNCGPMMVDQYNWSAWMHTVWYWSCSYDNPSYGLKQPFCFCSVQVHLLITTVYIFDVLTIVFVTRIVNFDMVV